MDHVACRALMVVLLYCLVFPTESVAQVVLDCDYFTFQEQAQAILDEDPTDPNLLDEDKDGVACPELPLADPSSGIPELPNDGDYQCVDFPHQELAQQVYDSDSNDPHNLDPSGDAVACSRLPLLADIQGAVGASVNNAPAGEPALDNEAIGGDDGANVRNQPAEGDRCEVVAEPVVEGIATGILPETGASLRGVRAVRSSDFERVWFVAADLEGSELDGADQIGLWATNNIEQPGAGFILSVDGLALEFTDWPDGAQTDAQISQFDDGAEEAKECVRASLV